MIVYKDKYTIMNQNEKDLIWLAGFIDADGCIRLSKGWKNKKGQYSLIPQVSIHNTSIITLNKVIEILEKNVSGYQTTQRVRQSFKHSKMYSISLMGIKRVKPFLEKIVSYLVTKNLEARLLLRFMEVRLEAERLKSHNAKYGSEEFKIFFALKNLKMTRHLRDYAPSIDEIINEDIVRTNARVLEEAEMASRLSEETRKEFASKLVWYRKDRSKK